MTPQNNAVLLWGLLAGVVVDCEVLQEDVENILPAQPQLLLGKPQLPPLQPHQPANTCNKAFDSLREIVAFGLEELSEQGIDRLLKIVSHPNFVLSDVVKTVKNKTTFFEYVAQQPHLVSSGVSHSHWTRWVCAL